MENRATLEVIAPTIEEAIAMGAAELGLPEDSFDIEVLDPGSRGLFGIGSRQARVRLTVKGSIDLNVTPTAEKPTSIPQTLKVITKEVELPAPDTQESMPASDKQTNSDDDITLHVARETVEELLERMKIKASVVVYHGEPDEEEGRSPVNVDINGKDLSILIGRQAETLNALQYISSLIVGKELGHSIPLVVDVENYRKRRQQQIRHLARRMADQAIKTGRRQVLEPMPANERRIVHIELRDNPQVKTESIGEEPRRKVTIIPR
jgi:spoIIIJ-associated protein